MEPFARGTLLDERVLQDLGVTQPPSQHMSMRQQ